MDDPPDTPRDPESDPGSDPFATESRPGALEAAIVALSDGWAAGKRPRAEQFLAGVLPLGPGPMRELVYHEFCLAEAAGDDPDPLDYFMRFPEVRHGLARLFGLHEVPGPDARPSWGEIEPEPPETGDEIGPYRLLRELGRGGMGRVFLAEQADLEDRLVVLKLTARPSPEADLLARARHPHIVEVLRRGEVAGGRFYLLALPFLGGASLAAVLAERARKGGRRSGRDWMVALDRVAAPEFAPDVSRSAGRVLINRLTHAGAAAWMVARLAEALGHANRLGVTHGDLKPANILIAADGRPMLLDFNLAVDWRSADAELGGITGGTLAYMAPERLRALADPKSTPQIRPADRHRADLYALGLVLREMISGRPPDVPTDPPVSLPIAAARLAEARERADPSRWTKARGMPASIRPILARLLAPDPIDRYAGMGELSEDLDRWGAGLPLIHAREGGGTDRALRWMARHRRRLAVVAAVLAVGVSVGLGAHRVVRARLRAQAEAKLATLWNSGDPAVFRMRRFGGWSREDTAALARRNLAHYEVIEGDWRARDDVDTLGPTDRADLEMWLLENAWRLASDWAGRVDAVEDWQRALGLLERSSEWAGLEAFQPLRRSLRERLGAPIAASYEVHPTPWLTHYAEGLAAEGRSLSEARDHYLAVLARWPKALWPRYRAGVVSLRQKRPGEAVDHLTICLGSRPLNPALWTVRAACRLAADDALGALADCNRALELDADYPDAYLARCVVRIRLNLLDGQDADAARLAQLARSRGRSLSLGLSLTRGGVTGQAPPPGIVSDDANLQAMVANQLLRAGKEAAALEILDRAIASAPDHLAARYDRACILLRQRRNEGLNEFAALVADPRYEELVRFDPRTIQAMHHLTYYRLRDGAAVEARGLAERGLALAMASCPSVETSSSPLVAESRYGLARALVQAAPGDLGAAHAAADLLDAAGRADPTWLRAKFPRDRFFIPSRPAIAARLERLRKSQLGPLPKSAEAPRGLVPPH